MYKKQSFTLIEILVVIVIIGILSSFIFFTINDSVEKANIAKTRLFEESIQNNLILNMISNWKLDEGVDLSAFDDWGSNVGTLTNGPIWKTGDDCMNGSCLSFDGENDYLYIPSGKIDLNNKSFTVSLWANIERYGDPDSPCWDDRSILFKWYNGSGFFVGTTNSSLRMYYTTHSCGECHFCAKKEGWNLITVTYNNSLQKMKIYQNTQQCGGDVSITTPLTGVNSSTYIGGGDVPGCGIGYSKAVLDDVKIYYEALTSFQIQQNYIAGLDSLLSKGKILKEEYDQRMEDLSKK
jgi:prepilin-type N-terminal cleavage/methylation domain-containing protein